MTQRKAQTDPADTLPWLNGRVIAVLVLGLLLMPLLQDASAQNAAPVLGADSLPLSPIHHLAFNNASSAVDDCAYAELHQGLWQPQAPHSNDMRLVNCGPTNPQYGYAAFTFVTDANVEERGYPAGAGNTAPSVRLAYADVNNNGKWDANDWLYLTTSASPKMVPTTSPTSFTIRLTDTMYGRGQWVVASDADLVSYGASAPTIEGSWAWTDDDHNGMLSLDDNVYLLVGVGAHYPAGATVPANAVLIKGPRYHGDPGPTPSATSTGTSAAPTPLPTSTPVPERARGRPAILSCNVAAMRPADTYSPQVDVPDAGRISSGVVVVSGRTIRGPSAPDAASSIETRVYARLGSNDYLLGSHAGVGEWSINWDVTSAHGGRYQLWALAHGPSQDQLSNTQCFLSDYQKRVVFDNAAHWTEPEAPQPQQAASLFVRFEGSSDYGFPAADILHFVDDVQVGRVRAAVATQPSPDGRYRFFLGDGSDVPSGFARGTHQHRVEVRFDDQGGPSYIFRSQPVSFEVGKPASSIAASPSAINGPVQNPIPDFRNLPSYGPAATVDAVTAAAGLSAFFRRPD
jgi:hypothetical protein